MNQKRFDLHFHTVHSDGTDSVDEIIDLAQNASLAGLSITDHDTLDAYPEALEKIKSTSLKLLPGIELSCAYGEHSVHILAYSFSLKDKGFRNFIEGCQKVREKRNVEILEKLKQEGMPLELSKLKENIGVVGRPHIANALLSMGYVKSIYEAFNLYIGDGKKCYVAGQRPSVNEAIEKIHEANAFAVIAHPHLIRSNKLLKELLNLNFDGLEAYYAKFPPREEKKWVQLANNRNWIKTGGSDYHGSLKPQITLGCSWVSEATFNPLYDRYLENEQLSNVK